MDCTHKCTFVAIIIYLLQDKAICQYARAGNSMIRENRECTKIPSTPLSTDMYNSILQTAAANGVLPDLIPMLQGQTISENFQRFPHPQDILTKPLSVVPMPNCNGQEPIIFSSHPIRPSSPNQNVLVATPIPCGSGCVSNVLPTIPQNILPPALPSTNCVSQIAQALPIENYPACTPNIGVLRPTPIVLQSQGQFNEVNPYNPCSQIAEPICLPDVTPLNVPSSPFSGLLELTPNLVSPCISQPTAFPCECQPLQISVPASLSAPIVTFVSPSNLPVPFCPDYSTNYPFQFPPQPPIVLESSKSSLRNLLPILLVALLNDRGCNGGGGCCRCCCSCNGGSGNTVPIPYPIPIPINCPIINSPYPYSRNLDDGDDEDYW